MKYKCARCGVEFNGLRTHEEALEEFIHTFPGENPTTALVICDDCWQEGIALGIINAKE